MPGQAACAQEDCVSDEPLQLSHSLDRDTETQRRPASTEGSLGSAAPLQPTLQKHPQLPHCLPWQGMFTAHALALPFYPGDLLVLRWKAQESWSMGKAWALLD